MDIIKDVWTEIGRSNGGNNVVNAVGFKFTGVATSPRYRYIGRYLVLFTQIVSSPGRRSQWQQGTMYSLEQLFWVGFPFKNQADGNALIVAVKLELDLEFNGSVEWIYG